MKRYTFYLSLCLVLFLVGGATVNDTKKEISLQWPNELSESEIEGLHAQLEILKKPQSGKKLYRRKDLVFVVECILQENSRCSQGAFHQHLRAVRLNGSEGLGKVQYTGYFTPQFEARKEKTLEFQYPIFKRPAEWRREEGPFATREEIERKGALDGRDLEIAWMKKPFAIFQMRTQGSGIIKFEDGTERLLAYDGKNGHPYVSVGKLLIEDGHIEQGALSFEDVNLYFEKNPDHVEKYLYQNPSYVFFKPKGTVPVGAAGTQLQPGHSIAVDPKIIPYGAVLLGKVPIVNGADKVTKFEWRLLFAQDTGAAIVGPSHVDLFAGIGDEAKTVAHQMNHFGDLWLLLPKKS